MIPGTMQGYKTLRQLCVTQLDVPRTSSVLTVAREYTDTCARHKVETGEDGTKGHRDGCFANYRRGIMDDTLQTGEHPFRRLKERSQRPVRPLALPPSPTGVFLPPGFRHSCIWQRRLRRCYLQVRQPSYGHHGQRKGRDWGKRRGVQGLTRVCWGVWETSGYFVSGLAPLLPFALSIDNTFFAGAEETILYCDFARAGRRVYSLSSMTVVA